MAGADLRDAVLVEANLRDADLTGVAVDGAKLGQADLTRARLHGVDLQRTVFGATNLTGAVLTDTRLQGVDLSRCRADGIQLAGAWLDKTRINREQLGDVLGEELAGRYGDARLAYLAVERNFIGLGDADAASWAYRRRRRMEKLQARERARAARAQGDRRAAAGWYAKFAGDQAVEWLCDYGESVRRVLLTMLAMFVLFTLIYGLTDGVVRVTPTPSGQVITPTRNPLDWVIFSMSAMTTSGKQPAGLLPSNAGIQLLAAVQSILGIALAGLVGFVFGNSSRR
jgi:hypothetical protein